jgi:hypothetical protein
MEYEPIIYQPTFETCTVFIERDALEHNIVVSYPHPPHIKGAEVLYMILA